MSDNAPSLAHIFRPRQLAPSYTITSPLPVEQCRVRLTGRETPGRLGDRFTAALRLRGQVFQDSLTLRLPSHAIFGELQPRESGTQIILRVSNRRTDAKPVLDFTVMLAVIAIPFVVYDWWQNQSLPAILILPAILLGLGWIRELSIKWPDYPNAPDEAAHMLAGLVEGSLQIGADNFTARSCAPGIKSR